MSHGAILAQVSRELTSATAKFGAFASAHEGYAVLLEEVDELWAEVRSREASVERMREEAIQVAAMAIRFIVDICEPEPEPDESGEYRGPGCGPGCGC
jgi:hypothetical protein